MTVEETQEITEAAEEEDSMKSQWRQKQLRWA